MRRHLNVKRRIVFKRLAFAFALTVLFMFIGINLIAWLVSEWFTGNSQQMIGMALVFAGLIIALLMLLSGSFVWFFRRFGTPLAEVMAAADAVADGNLDVQVPEKGTREFADLATSFNRMVKELQRADQQRRNLTADVAHELRTPLHIIQGNLEGILDGVYQPSEDHLQATLDETRLLARLVDDLQTLSLAESGQLSLKQEQVDVGDLLADIVTSFSSQAELKGISIQQKNHNTPESIIITGDSGRLDQVLGNLVNNALRHTPQGGVIQLQAEKIKDGIRITVSDNGEGIPAADLPFIFDRFWRGDRSRTHTAGASSGLGLAISKQLIQAHHGSIEVKSKPGEGTTFIITLPLKMSDVPATP